MWRSLLTLVFVCAAPSLARAVPGPDSVAVLANSAVPESVALANQYARARAVPASQICPLPWSTESDISLEEFRAGRAALLDCLGDTLPRIEAVLVIRGVPLRVRIPVEGADQLVSFAAALGVHETTVGDSPLLGQPPGQRLDCGGSPCLGAVIRNPFVSGIFEAGWERTVSETTFRPWLVTMLHGRSFEEAALLLDSALTAEREGPTGEFLFMEGRDSARSALDGEFPAVIADLRERGLGARSVPFDPELTGLSLGAFITGTASIGSAIEENTLLPGSLVDNLTSFGAHPENFEFGGEVQVSISRWVARGAAGVHGTTAEPLANAFPSRRFLVAYADGATLAESYLRAMPFVYWQNLVLGDPMLAPFAVRPTLDTSSVPREVPSGTEFSITAGDPEGFGVNSVAVYSDGVLLAESETDSVSFVLQGATGTSASILVVAQKRDDGSARGLYRPKGWSTTEVTFTEHLAIVDAGTPLDAGADVITDVDADVGALPAEPSGCECSAQENAAGEGWLVFFALVVRGYSRRSFRKKNQA